VGCNGALEHSSVGAAYAVLMEGDRRRRIFLFIDMVSHRVSGGYVYRHCTAAPKRIEATSGYEKSAIRIGRSMNSCLNCKFFYEAINEGESKSKTFCRRRIHSGSMGSKPETQVDMRTGISKLTGMRREMIVSYFPETKPDWWCGEWEPPLGTYEEKNTTMD